MNPMLEGFLSGAVVTAALTCSLFFVRFWRRTGENLFVAFAVAFLIEGATRIATLFRDHPNEASPWLYVVRVIAYGGLVYAIVRKNYG